MKIEFDTGIRVSSVCSASDPPVVGDYVHWGPFPLIVHSVETKGDYSRVRVEAVAEIKDLMGVVVVKRTIYDLEKGHIPSVGDKETAGTRAGWGNTAEKLVVARVSWYIEQGDDDVYVSDTRDCVVVELVPQRYCSTS